MRSGKVRYVGCSNFSGWQMTKALGISDRLGYQRFVSTQVYSPCRRATSSTRSSRPPRPGLGILVWSPLAGGLLSGKYRRGQKGPEGARHLQDWGEPPVRDEEGLYDIIEALVEIGEEHGVSAAQIALAWSLGRPGITSLIVGARTEEQLADNLAAVEVELSEAERARLDELTAPAAAVPVLAPGRHGVRPPERHRPDLDRTAPGDVGPPGSGSAMMAAQGPDPRAGTRERGGIHAAHAAAARGHGARGRRRVLREDRAPPARDARRGTRRGHGA